MSVSPLLLRRVFPGYEFYWGGEVIELEGGGAPDSAALFDLVHHVVSLIGDLVVEDNDGLIANPIAGRARVDDVVSGDSDRGGWDFQNVVFEGSGGIGVLELTCDFGVVVNLLQRDVQWDISVLNFNLS